MTPRILFVMLLVVSYSYAQINISGKVIDKNKDAIPYTNIFFKDTNVGTTSNFNGEFKISFPKEKALTLVISSIGFKTEEISISKSMKFLEITLEEGSTLDEVVIAASRNKEKLFSSPVTIEKLSLKDFKNTASLDFYDSLENLKGIDINTNSLTYKSINARGFATFTNTRFVQLIDGVDNSSPSLNFPLGNLIGISELDLASIEVLPGASSALYGANAFNGIILMNSKSPFKHQGISTYAKTGVTSQDAGGDNSFYDLGIRIAKAFSDKFAAKANISYISGTDWFATDTRDLNNPNNSDRTSPSYNGLNVYGDDFTFNLGPVIGDVSRTGYDEQDLTDYKAESLKLSTALHYKPFADDFEIIYNARIGQGSTVYQGANRYYLKGFLAQQHRLELRNNNFFLRGYISAEDGGDTYDMRFAGLNLNRRWKSDEQWFTEYGIAFAQALQSGLNSTQAHTTARTVADTGRLQPGTAEFTKNFNQVVSNANFSEGGALFLNKTRMYHSDFKYNFSHLTKKLFDLQTGGSFRRYRLNSFGTIYTDADGPISYDEFGVYSQIQKRLLNNKLLLTGSLRYDKSELFDGNFSPRVGAGYTFGKNKNHNLRFSHQTAFRNPTTQDLFIGIDLGAFAIVGSADENLDRYVQNFSVGDQTITQTGRDIHENSFSASSVATFSSSRNPNDLKIANPNIVKPERVRTFEIGYRSKLKKITLDMSMYHNTYKDFIVLENVIVPYFGKNSNFDLSGLATGNINVDTQAILESFANSNFQVYQSITNARPTVRSYGGSVGFNTELLKFNIGLNYTYSKLDFDQTKAPDLRSTFNTPEHKIKASLGRNNVFKNFGFNTNLRWSDSYLWEDSFAEGNVPSFTVIDTQISYHIPDTKIILKAGGNNITNQEYFSALGTGRIGSLYFLKLNFNDF